MVAAHKLQEMQALICNTGYVNNVKQTQELMDQTENMLSTMALAAIADREAVANVVIANTDLTMQMSRVIAISNAIQVRLATVKVRQENGSGQANGRDRQLG